MKLLTLLLLLAAAAGAVLWLLARAAQSGAGHNGRHARAWERLGRE